MRNSKFTRGFGGIIGLAIVSGLSFVFDYCCNKRCQEETEDYIDQKFYENFNQITVDEDKGDKGDNEELNKKK